MKTIATIFSGGGGVEVGAIAAGYQPIWGIEKNAAVAEVYRMNLGDHVICEDAQTVNPSGLDRPDVLWASPECQFFSVALQRHSKHQITHNPNLGLCVIPYLETLKPDTFILENVRRYQKHETYTAIVQRLRQLGYWYANFILNAADFGVPQDRKRLILIAKRGEMFLSPIQSGCCRSWYNAIIDLLPELPETVFPPWQHPALKKALQRSQVFMMDGKALRDKVSTHYRLPTTRLSNEPCFTICKWHWKQAIRVHLNDRAVKLTPRAIARMQSFPDDYRLPNDNKLAIQVIGNAVPPLMVQRILEGV